MKYLWTILSFLGLCSVPAKVVACNSAITSVVLDNLFDRVKHYTPTDIGYSNNYDTSYWNPKFDENQKEIDKIRFWANTLTDRCVHDQYIHWLHFYETSMNEAKEELRTHSRQKSSAEYDAHEKQRQKELAELRRSKKVPAPPK